MAITDGLGEGLVDRVLAAIAGGATAVQLRAKGEAGRAVYQAAVAVVAATRGRVCVIVNDRMDIALAAGADGVHLGPDDLPVAAARRLRPEGFILGGSAGSVADAVALEGAGADYLGVGAIFDAHGSKQDASAPRGVGVLTDVRGAVRIPILAIGGVNDDNAASCIDAGASGIAVIRAIFADPDVTVIEARVDRLRRRAFGEAR